MILPIRTIAIEGCDLSGKTTFYNDFHKETKFAYDVRDRGPVSRVVYARMYGRDHEHETREMHRFFDDLNNFVIFLIPGWKTVSERFDQRGDEIHDKESLRRTWEEFNSFSGMMQRHPSVVTNFGVPETRVIKDIVAGHQNMNTSTIASNIEHSLKVTDRNESLDIRFDAYATKADDLGAATMLVKGEEEYYQGLETGLMNRIKSETISGQSSKSRRFLTTNDSCISYLRFIHRDDADILDMVCRSTNVPKNLKHDLDAAIHIGFKAQSRLGLDNRNILLRARLHCAHIVP